MDNKIKITILMLMAVLLSTIVYAVTSLTDEQNLDVTSVNGFFDNKDNMVSLLIPAVLLLVCVVMFAIDYGAIGVSAASIIALFALFLLRIVYMNVISLVSLMIIIGIMIYKMQST